jgi:trehalose/maltose transport system substrate-binding protein
MILLFAMPLVLLLYAGWNQPLRYIFSPPNKSSLKFQLPPGEKVFSNVTSAPPVVSAAGDVVNPLLGPSPINSFLKFYGNRNNHEAALKLEAGTSTRFTIDSGVRIEIFNPQPEERLSRLKQTLASRSREYDAVMIDIIWVGELGSHLIDLQPFLGEEIEDHNQKILNNNYVKEINNNKVENRLVAIPWFQNRGLLFYRRDLVEKYREDLWRETGDLVPKTWEQLEKAAAIIQAKERQKDSDFIGFAWQGAEYEGLTCNALEWIASEGALAFNADTGRPLFDHAGVLDALDRARRWVKGKNAISPDAKHHMEHESLQAFLHGKAAFLRGWSNEYAILERAGSEFGVAPLPRGRGEKSFSVLGGWQLAVPKYSLDQRSSIEFIRYLSGPEVQKWRAKEGTYQPTIEKLFQDIDVQKALPFLNDDWFHNIELIIRPSSQLGDRYNGVSWCIYTSVYAALGRNSKKEIEKDINNMKNCIDICMQVMCPEDMLDK